MVYLSGGLICWRPELLTFLNFSKSRSHIALRNIPPLFHSHDTKIRCVDNGALKKKLNRKRMFSWWYHNKSDLDCAWDLGLFCCNSRVAPNKQQHYVISCTGRTVNDVVFLRMLPLGGAACVHYVAWNSKCPGGAACVHYVAWWNRKCLCRRGSMRALCSLQGQHA